MHWASPQGLHLSARIIPERVVVADEDHAAEGVVSVDVIVQLSDPVIGENAAG